MLYQLSYSRAWILPERAPRKQSRDRASQRFDADDLPVAAQLLERERTRVVRVGSRYLYTS